jgi:hypothetical protein
LLPPADDRHRSHEEPTVSVPEVVGLVVVVGGTAAVTATAASSYVAPILAFVGAILVAVIAAVTADRRQRRALTAEGARHDASLRAESGRQVTQLEHSRGLADLADLRSLLDEVATALHQARYAADEVRLQYIQHGKLHERAKT